MDDDISAEKKHCFLAFFPRFFGWDGLVFRLERGIAFLYFYYQNNFEVVRLQ